MVALLHRINRQFIRSYTFIIVLFFALLNFGFYFVNRSSSFSFPYLALVGYSTFAMLFGLVVHQVVTRDSRIINGIFSIQPLRFFGRISYGLYIIHWPLYLILQPVLTEQLAKFYSGAQFEWIISLAATLMAVLLSWLSFRYFESRFLALKNR
jgi:peptidoglycan/LPS O-acetylase OafA/YrhL